MTDVVKSPVGRLAPSPTGAQHLGNARTYILAWLSIRSRGGHVVLRIEDIDSPRVKPWAIDQAIEDLAWLGLDWDEGPDIGGSNGPYIQTEREDRYRARIDWLRQLDLIYPCTCSRRDIEQAASAPHESIDGPIYPGTCSRWRHGEPVPTAVTYCWRFRTSTAKIEFDDGLMGTHSLVPHSALGDFPITRKTGEAAYQLAVVDDDIAMGITEVFRGNDLIPSTFRQINLYQSFEHLPPHYVHVPLVCGPDGRRLAKRHGDTRLSQYRAQGVSPESIVGWALSSAGVTDSNEPVSAREMIDHYDVSRIPREDTVLPAEFAF